MIVMKNDVGSKVTNLRTLYQFSNFYYQYHYVYTIMFTSLLELTFSTCALLRSPGKSGAHVPDVRACS